MPTRRRKPRFRSFLVIWLWKIYLNTSGLFKIVFGLNKDMKLATMQKNMRMLSTRLVILNDSFARRFVLNDRFARRQGIFLSKWRFVRSM